MKGVVYIMALEWHVVTSATYYAAAPETLNDEFLYFLSDTGELFKGAKSFSQAIVKLESDVLPATPARNRLYILPSLEGKIYTGTEWVTVIKPIDATVTAEGANAVTGKAVHDFVATKISEANGATEEVAGDLADLTQVVNGTVTGLTYDKDGAKLVMTKVDGSTADVALHDFAVGVQYNKQTGALELLGASGQVLGETINLDLERFVSSAEYDAESNKIKLTFNDESEPLEIDVAGLVDTYTAENSETIALTCTGNVFKAEAIVAATEGNMLQKTAEGLYVAAADMSAYMKLATGCTAGDMLTVDAQGQVVKASVTVGGATLAEVPAATTLATEAAVEAVRAALAGTIDALAQRVGTLETKVGALETKMGTAEGDIAQLKVDVAAAAKAANDEKARAEQVEGELRSAIEGHGTDIAALQAQLTWKTTL